MDKIKKRTQSHLRIMNNSIRISWGVWRLERRGSHTASFPLAQLLYENRPKQSLNFWRRSTLGFLWNEWCWSWNSSTLTSSWEELTHWKRLWCWKGLGAVGERGDRGWDGWMASWTQWTWVSVISKRLWWTGRPCMLRFMGSQRVGHDWATELNYDPCYCS